MFEPDDTLIDEKAASAMFGMSTAWFQRDRWSGATIPFIRIGRAIRYRVGDLRAEIAKRRVEVS